MTQRVVNALLSAISVFIPSTASADYFTGNDIHRLCTQDRSVVSGYVAGWIGKQEVDANVMRKLQVLVSPDSQQVVAQAERALSAGCVPEGATLGQLTDVLCKSIASIPEVRHEPAEAFVSAILLTTFPCAK